MFRRRSAATADEGCTIFHAPAHDICEHGKIHGTNAAYSPSGIGFADQRNRDALFQAAHKRRQRFVRCNAVHSEGGGSCLLQFGKNGFGVMARSKRTVRSEREGNHDRGSALFFRGMQDGFGFLRMKQRFGSQQSWFQATLATSPLPFQPEPEPMKT